MTKVIRFILVLAMMVGLLAVPSAPAAGTTTTGTVKFSGLAVVGITTFLGLYTGTPLAPGAPTGGLCIPGKHPIAPAVVLAPGVSSLCVESPPAVVTPTNGFLFTIKKGLPVTGSVEFCIAEGLIAGAPAVDPACHIKVDGDVLEATPGVGPHCGLSMGTSVPDPTGTPDGIFISTTGVKHQITVTWPPSAGGTLPIIGTMMVGGLPSADVHMIAGVVNAAPKADPTMPATKRACIHYPATKFLINGSITVS